MERTDPPETGTERELLLGFVNYMRETLLFKCQGLSDEQLQATLAPSTMTLGGMLAHLDFVEDYWITHILLGNIPSEPWVSAPWGEDADWDWHSAASRTGDDLRSALVRRGEASSASIADLDLDVVAKNERRPVSLRWILLHFIEEYARHCGHADLIRESIDGVVGE